MKYGVLVAVVLAAIGAGAYYVIRDDAATPISTGAGALRSGPPAAGAFAGAFGGPQPPPLVTLGEVRREQLYDIVDALGTAAANESVTLTAKVTDTVRSVEFEDGDYVEAGTVLVQLTNQEEQALLAEARANLDDAESQLRRVENLAEQKLTSESELDIARSRAAASAARLETIVARLRDRLIQAPFAGVLGFRQVSPGTLLAPSTPITTLDDISIIKLDFTVPETFLGAMQPGARVLAQSVSYRDRQFEGVVRTVGSRVDPVTRAIQVRAHVPNDDRALRPGMLLTVRVVMAERPALVVRENAVYQIQDRAYVYRVGPDMVAREQEIEIGERRFGLVEVRGGLEEGDHIVVEGIVKLRDGARVRVAGDESPIDGNPSGRPSGSSPPG
jgi:membrane fusion protein (multidrug efflux system)